MLNPPSTSSWEEMITRTLVSFRWNRKREREERDLEEKIELRHRVVSEISRVCHFPFPSLSSICCLSLDATHAWQDIERYLSIHFEFYRSQIHETVRKKKGKNRTRHWGKISNSLHESQLSFRLLQDFYDFFWFFSSFSYLFFLSLSPSFCLTVIIPIADEANCMKR